MDRRFRTGGFERRLLVFFLLLSVTPTLLIAIFGARYFAGYLDRLSNVALRQSFRNSMEIARQFSGKLERDAVTISRHIREDFRGPRTRAPNIEAFLQASCQRHDADFAAFYVLASQGWRLGAAHPSDLSRIDTLVTFDTLPPEHEPQKMVFTDQDVIAAAVPISPDSVLVSGYLLEPGTMDMMRRTGQDYSRYSSIGLYVDILRRYSVIVISALVVIMAVSSALASRVLAKRISHPIRELALATDRIAKGDLDHRVTVTARDEIQSLVTSFNDMTRDLQEYKRNLIRAERIAAWRDVARRIAHDIKNPLTPITIAIHRLKKRMVPEHEDSHVIEECLDSILREVDVLKTMAEEFSSFAKMPEPKLTEIDLNETVRSVLDLYRSSFEGIDVKTSFGRGLPSIHADADQLRRVVGNLIKNAVEAMKARGGLTISTYSLPSASEGTAGTVRVEISDTGPGIPDEIRERIFDPYFTTKEKGTGLGLAMAYRIIQDHGGMIRFTTGPKGTTFSVDLSAAPDRTTDRGADWGAES